MALQKLPAPGFNGVLITGNHQKSEAHWDAPLIFLVDNFFSKIPKKHLVIKKFARTFDY
jgi:hypothetical protein